MTKDQLIELVAQREAQCIALLARVDALEDQARTAKPVVTPAVQAQRTAHAEYMAALAFAKDQARMSGRCTLVQSLFTR